MAELKTKRTGKSVDAFLNGIADDRIRADCWALVAVMEQATKAKPELWSSGLVGFGRFQYKTGAGPGAEWMLAAFAPRKQKITLYIMPGCKDRDQLLARLGPHSGGKSCVHIKRLADVHVPTLKKLLSGSVKHLKRTFPASS